MIEVKDVWYTYPNGVQAIKGVDLSVEDGELAAIMGENGAGKTTLVKHFNGLLKPQKGSVLVDGVDTRSLSVAKLARKVGLVFQNPDHQLFEETVEKEVKFAMVNFGYPREVIEKRCDLVLDIFNLKPYKDQSPLALSSGERKRVALAAVLSYDPDVLILDEPTIGQDYSQKRRIGGEVKLLQAQGKTVIIVTHDVEFVVEHIPRTIVMSRGRVIADGSTRAVLTKRKVLKEANLLPPQITELAWHLSDRGLPRDMMTVQEAKESLLKLLNKGG